MIPIIVILLLLIVIVAFFIYAVYRMNIYIISLEETVKNKITLIENLTQSMKEIVAEGMLQNDGKLKKLVIQKERNFIYNGRNVSEENNIEI